ncbi:class F sortase [Candidatus Saccharibacteria bacterium]|nr:class F sortase [Candidatus Saccharibacteria bacterium]
MTLKNIRGGFLLALEKTRWMRGAQRVKVFGIGLAVTTGLVVGVFVQGARPEVIDAGAIVGSEIEIAKREIIEIEIGAAEAREVAESLREVAEQRAEEEREREAIRLAQTAQVGSGGVTRPQGGGNTPSIQPNLPLAPSAITIPGIGTVNGMLSLGINARGEVDVPSNIWQTAWFNGSSMPGTRGAAFVVGHTPGIFTGLRNLSMGQVISITMNNGAVINYRIQHIETVALGEVNMWRNLTTWNGAAEGLNLMTCAGHFVPALGTYSHRLSVFTVRI